MWGMPKCAAISAPCVPLPAPGGATISTRIPTSQLIIPPAGRQVDTRTGRQHPNHSSARAAAPRTTAPATTDHDAR